MKITEIEVSKILSIVSHFNKIEFRAAAKAELDDDEDANEAFSTLKETVEITVNQEIRKSLSTLNELGGE
jgi:hypothetical protein